MITASTLLFFPLGDFFIRKWRGHGTEWESRLKSQGVGTHEQNGWTVRYQAEYGQPGSRNAELFSVHGA